MSIFYSAILLNFKVLYLELQSEVHSKFYSQRSIPNLGKVVSFDRYSVEFG